MMEMSIETTNRMIGQILRSVIQQQVEVALVKHGIAIADEPGTSASGLPPEIDPYALVAVAEFVLTEAGGPLHVTELARRMYGLGFKHRWPPKHRDQLERSLNSLASPSQRPDRFKRVGPRTLALR
jgi:hypothetical protein